MDQRLGVQAKDLLAILPEKQLMKLFIEYGGEREARSVAKAIVAHRAIHPITTTQELATLMEKTKREPRGKLHPATKVFQALRMAVNMELESISTALPQAYRVLKASGRLVTISFHEGEDRIVKDLFRKWQREGKGQQMNQDVITPSPEEVAANSRSRSAKLRIFLKTK
jgi:16S rRNA (cytosine1402-N4)-methyltransferase